MRLLKISLFFFSIVSLAQNKLVTPYEIGNGNQTTTYEQCIAFYQKLDAAFPTIQMIEKGKTDSGKPLHLVLFSVDATFESNANKTVILINNGIHPGEPDGIDATMLLLRDLATGKVKAPKNVLFAAIPVYNIGGMLNRNSYSRANQNGPEAYGFRGNARNFDLNRDFIKSDSKNSRSFQAIFSELQPDIFLDNHVSNGADYQYTFTCIATQHERLGGALGEFFSNEMYPEMVKDMQKKKIDVVPYVNVYGTTPEKNGFNQFPDTPRYATGYTTLFNTLGFVPETHMLKAYNERVKVTYEFMVSAINYAEKNHAKIKSVRAAAATTYKAGDSYPIDWAIDSSKVSYIDFKGFEAGYKPSDVSGKNRLYYDRSKPFTKKIPFYGKYKATQFVTVPKAYIVPQSQWPVLDILLLNKMEYSQLKKDTIIEVETYKIAQYETSKSPYEGHYGHYNTKVNRQTEKIQFFAGDYVFSTEQKGMKYLLETLEPEAVDSYFNWNFFDAILQQKEYFSSYVFEDLAKEFLDKNPKIKAEFEQKKQEDKKFAENGAAQLDWVYKKSPHYEKAHLLYPVFRLF